MSFKFETRPEKCNKVNLKIPAVEEVTPQPGDFFSYPDGSDTFILGAYLDKHDVWSFVAVSLINGNRFRNPLPTIREATEDLRWLGKMDITIKPKG